MCNVPPLRIILDGVVEVSRPDRKRDDIFVAQTVLAIRVLISSRDSLADLALNAIPLLLGRFLFHPPFIIGACPGNPNQIYSVATFFSQR